MQSAALDTTRNITPILEWIVADIQEQMGQAV
jgi:hypothetical protein